MPTLPLFHITALLLATLILGAATVLLPYSLRNPASFQRAQRALSRLSSAACAPQRGVVRRLRAALPHWLSASFRYPELGGYVHDTAVALWIHFTQAAYSAGTWTATAASNVWFNRRTAADATFTIQVPVLALSNGSAQKGSYLKSVDVHYRIGTANMDSVAATLYKATLAADGSLLTVASVATSYDSGHDTAAERIDVDEHKLTLTLSTPAWIDDGEYYFVELVCDAAATSVFDFFGAVANITLRL